MSGRARPSLPASTKRSCACTQAKRISEEYGVPHIATGDLLRDNVARRTAELSSHFEHHPHRALTQLRRVLRRPCHDSSLSRLGASTKPGAVHLPVPCTVPSGRHPAGAPARD